jgi:hypothetical protein
MKLLEEIKQSILNGDWAGVCRAYNKITGENISPPVLIKEFDIQTAKKADLYQWLKERREMDDSKKYTTAKLRELAELFKMMEDISEDTEESIEEVSVPAQPVQNKSSNMVAAPFYVSGADLTVADKKLAESSIAIPPDHKKFIDSGYNNEFTPASGRMGFELEEATCLVCNALCKTRPENISTITGVPSTTCERCMSTRRG